MQFSQKRVSQHGLSRNIFVAHCVAQSRTQLYISQRIAATCSTIAQCNTPPATCLAILWQILARAHALSFCLSFRGALQDKLLRKLRSVTMPQHQTSATCNATISTIVIQVAEKIAQCKCNRALMTLNKSFLLVNWSQKCVFGLC